MPFCSSCIPIAWCSVKQREKPQSFTFKGDLKAPFKGDLKAFHLRAGFNGLGSSSKQDLRVINIIDSLNDYSRLLELHDTLNNKQ